MPRLKHELALLRLKQFSSYTCAALKLSLPTSWCHSPRLKHAAADPWSQPCEHRMQCVDVEVQWPLDGWIDSAVMKYVCTHVDSILIRTTYKLELNLFVNKVLFRQLGVACIRHYCQHKIQTRFLMSLVDGLLSKWHWCSCFGG
jgi:hypothetical protein